MITYHEALKWLLTYKESTGRLARWRVRFLEYHFDIQFRKGTKHQFTDALSRLETEGHETGEIDDDLPGELIIGAIVDKADVLELDNTFDDNKPSLDVEDVTNVMTCSKSTSKEKLEQRDKIS